MKTKENYYWQGIARIIKRYCLMHPTAVFGQMDGTTVRDRANERGNHQLIRRLGGQPQEKNRG